MATGLTVSFIANLCVGLLGCLLAEGSPPRRPQPVVQPSCGVSTLPSQSMGAAPAIIALSRWYPLKKRGTYYGFFQRSHNLGEAFISFVFVDSSGLAGWKWGIRRVGHCRSDGRGGILLFLHDTAPPVESADEKRRWNGNGRPRKRSEIPTSGYRPGQRLHVRQPLRHKRLGRHLPSGGQRLPAATATQVIRQRLSRHRRDGLFGMDVRQMVQREPLQYRRDVRRALFRVVSAFPVLWLRDVRKHPRHGPVRHRHRGSWICFVGGFDGRRSGPAPGQRAQRSGSSGSPAMWVRGFRTSSAAPLLDKHKTVVDGITTHDYSVASVFWIAASVLSFLLVGGRLAQGGEKQPAAKLNENGTAYVT